nr:MAG TPA: hypothetical protein [Caudoviricetes sp.]
MSEFDEILKEMGFEKIYTGQYQRIDLGYIHVPDGDLYELARQIFFLGKSVKCDEVASVLGFKRDK